MQGFRAYTLDLMLYQLPVGAHVCQASLHPVFPQCEFPHSGHSVGPHTTPRHCEWKVRGGCLHWNSLRTGYQRGRWQFSANDTYFLAVAPLILTIGILACFFALGLGNLRHLTVRGNSARTREGAYPTTLRPKFSFFFPSQKVFMGGFREGKSRWC